MTTISYNKIRSDKFGYVNPGDIIYETLSLMEQHAEFRINERDSFVSPMEYEDSTMAEFIIEALVDVTIGYVKEYGSFMIRDWTVENNALIYI